MDAVEGYHRVGIVGYRKRRDDMGKKLQTMVGSVWVNKKLGDRYRVVGVAKECTNSRVGETVVIYSNEDGTLPLYVREISEFLHKFSVEDELQSIADLPVIYADSEGGEI